MDNKALIERLRGSISGPLEISHGVASGLIEEAADALEACEARTKRLELLMQEFVDRCESGSIQSRYTYAKFKEALSE